jgi:hypothetical protein
LSTGLAVEVEGSDEADILLFLAGSSRMTLPLEKLAEKNVKD